MIERPAKSRPADTPPAAEEIDELSEYGSVTLIHGGRRHDGARHDGVRHDDARRRPTCEENT
ncbi:hypothetical protein HH310_29345 [Actinoplanes sp. TBRC 11911]|uniref:hypothetical protein n=1 Tax=Actinoplanes sp. TBRC 11911 TaxID=2729386 RepID=UPI00145C74D7|nr:hypothetical protein [Actinoplanes sp. TBRC 11911]NMO55277.1 hypothetical protein [Actinoplanes sp. TBRC 11911]